MKISKINGRYGLILLLGIAFFSCKSSSEEIQSDEPSYGRFFGTVGQENQSGIYEELAGYAFSTYMEEDSVFEISLESSVISDVDFTYLHFFIKGEKDIKPGTYMLRDIDQVNGINETGFSGIYRSLLLPSGVLYFSESGTLTINNSSDEGKRGSMEGVFFKKVQTGKDSYTRVYTPIHAEFNLYEIDESKFFVYDN